MWAYSACVRNQDMRVRINICMFKTQIDECLSSFTTATGALNWLTLCTWILLHFCYWQICKCAKKTNVEWCAEWGAFRPECNLMWWHDETQFKKKCSILYLHLNFIQKLKQYKKNPTVLSLAPVELSVLSIRSELRGTTNKKQLCFKKSCNNFSSTFMTKMIKEF